MLGIKKPKEIYIFDCIDYNQYINLICKSNYGITNLKEIRDIAKWILAYTLREVWLVDFVDDNLNKAINSSLLNTPQHYEIIFNKHRNVIEKEIMIRTYCNKFMRLREHELRLDIHGHAGILYY